MTPSIVRHHVIWEEGNRVVYIPEGWTLQINGRKIPLWRRLKWRRLARRVERERRIWLGYLDESLVSLKAYERGPSLEERIALVLRDQEKLAKRSQSLARELQK